MAKKYTRNVSFGLTSHHRNGRKILAVDFSRLGPAVQKQVLQALAQPKKSKTAAVKPEFESKLEEEYYYTYILPLKVTGKIVKVEMHITFELLPPAEYCGIKLHKAEYTPDFIIFYENGDVEIIEVKSKAVRKLQQSYVYRRRLFIEKYARPNGWKFTEYME